MGKKKHRNGRQRDLSVQPEEIDALEEFDVSDWASTDALDDDFDDDVTGGANGKQLVDIDDDVDVDWDDDDRW